MLCLFTVYPSKVPIERAKRKYKKHKVEKQQTVLASAAHILKLERYRED